MSFIIILHYYKQQTKKLFYTIVWVILFFNQCVHQVRISRFDEVKIVRNL